MDYFKGLRVHRFNHSPESTQRVDASPPTHVISYIHTGKIYWQTEGAEISVFNAPVAFVTWPGERWRYGPVDATWDNRFISWKGPRTRRMIQAGLFPQSEPSNAIRAIHDPDAFRDTFDHMLDLLADAAPDSPRVVYALEGLLLQLHEQPPNPLQARGPAAKIRKVIEAVHSEPEKDWDFTIEAKRAACTITHFRRLWKRETGCSPVQSLQNARISRAAALLRQNRLSIGQIAWDCGFENTSYFYRLFKAHHNLSPGVYRDVYQRID